MEVQLEVGKLYQLSSNQHVLIRLDSATSIMIVLLRQGLKDVATSLMIVFTERSLIDSTTSMMITFCSVKSNFIF